MSACTNCRRIVEILKREIQELQEREENLERVNDALVEAVGQQQNQASQQHTWKSKYEDQARANR
jgi:hypothetical protein